VLGYLEGSKENIDVITRDELLVSGHTAEMLARYKPSVSGITVLDYIKKKGSATTDEVMTLLRCSQSSANTVLRGLVSLKYYLTDVIQEKSGML